MQFGLNGDDPVTIPVDAIDPTIRQGEQKNSAGRLKEIPFDPERDMIFHFDQALPYHANGLIFRAF